MHAEPFLTRMSVCDADSFFFFCFCVQGFVDEMAMLRDEEDLSHVALCYHPAMRPFIARGVPNAAPTMTSAGAIPTTMMTSTTMTATTTTTTTSTTNSMPPPPTTTSVSANNSRKQTKRANNNDDDDDDDDDDNNDDNDNNDDDDDEETVKLACLKVNGVDVEPPPGWRGVPIVSNDESVQWTRAMLASELASSAAQQQQQQQQQQQPVGCEFIFLFKIEFFIHLLR